MKTKPYKKTSALVTFNFETGKIEVWGLNKVGQKWASEDVKHVYEIDSDIEMPKALRNGYHITGIDSDFAGFFVEEALRLKTHFCDIQETIR